LSLNYLNSSDTAGTPPYFLLFVLWIIVLVEHTACPFPNFRKWICGKNALLF